MAKQFSGSNAKISYKPEADNGVLVTTLAADGQTTLNGAVAPGANTIIVADVAGLAAGKTIAVGAENNQEIVKILSVTAGPKRLTLSPNTKLNFRHAFGRGGEEA